MASFCTILALVMYSSAIYGQENDSQQAGSPQESAEQFQGSKDLDKKLAAKPSQLLTHMAERMNLDGEGLRHIRKHLMDVAGHGHLDDVLDIGEGDHTKGIFYFFRLHDDDNNQKLDGLEWLKALTHFHEGNKRDIDLMDNEAMTIIDELLDKHDNDKDGMIDFVELMNTKVDSVMNELSKEPQRESQHQQNQQDQQQQDQQQQDQQQQDQQQQDQQQQDQQQQDQQQQDQQQQDQQQDQQQQDQQQQDQQQQDQQQQDQQQQDQQQDQQQQDQQQQDQQQQDQQQQDQQQQDQQDQQQQDQQQDQQDQQQQDHQQQDQQDQQQQNNQ